MSLFKFRHETTAKLVHELGLPVNTSLITLRIDNNGILVASVDFYLTPDQAWALGLIIKTAADEQREHAMLKQP